MSLGVNGRDGRNSEIMGTRPHAGGFIKVLKMMHEEAVTYKSVWEFKVECK